MLSRRGGEESQSLSRLASASCKGNSEQGIRKSPLNRRSCVNLFFFLWSLFETCLPGRVFETTVGLIEGANHAADLVALDRSRYWASLDLNPERDAQRLKDGKPVWKLKNVVVRPEHLKHPDQTWALHQMLLTIREWTMLHEFLDINAHNLLNPGDGLKTGIEGLRIVEVGCLRYADPELRAQAE
jgi:hypothetical protein